MALEKVQFRPGIVRDTTNYTNEGGWFDGDMVRFRLGQPEKIGGWRKAVDGTFLGSCRALHEWMALDQNRFLALGTHLKYYILWGSAYYDITPIRSTAGPLTDPPFTTVGVSSLIVHHINHGATGNDFVTISGATAFDVYTVADLNREFQILEILGPNDYRIDTGKVSTTAGATGGGAAVHVEYQIYTGLDIAVPGTGYGAGPYGTPIGWGEGYDVTGTNMPYNQIRLWAQDNYGEDLVFNIRGGAIYYWARTTGVTQRGVPLEDMPGANEAPRWAFEVLISEGDRHVVAAGTNPLGEDYLDPLLVRWSSQENALDWEPRRDNTAGDYRLSSGSAIAGALRTRQEILLWTEKNLQSMRFVGAPYVFGFNLIAENVSVLSPTAMINAGGVVYWMDRGRFYAYTGQVQELPCPINDYIFSDFNMSQRMKVTVGHNHNFHEVIWFYPTEESEEVDRYALYNYVEQVWSFGQLERTAWLDLVFGGSYPIATKDGQLYNHEIGDDADGEPLPAWIESSDTCVGSGDHFLFIKRVIPDVHFRGDGSLQTVGITLKTRRAPGDLFQEPMARMQVDPHTRECHVRIRGREFAVRVESDALGTGWRLGTLRVDMQQDGRR